jgi:DNA repair exonuclease SbcCD ATPase subunit
VSAGEAADRLKRQVEQGAEKAQQQLEAAKADLEAKRRAAEGPPAEDADHAAQQVRDIRARLDQDLQALEARLPPRDTLVAQAKTVGGAAAAGVAVVAALGAWMKQRGAKKELEQEAERAARAIARHLPDAIAEVERRRARAEVEAELAEDDGFGLGRLLAIVALLGAAVGAVLAQRKRAAEPDLWGDPPPPSSPTA